MVKHAEYFVMFKARRRGNAKFLMHGLDEFCELVQPPAPSFFA